MAFEFYYRVSLSILHPTADPARITKAITHLRPTTETMAGTERRDKAGTPLAPYRLAQFSYWHAYFHQREMLFSGSRPLSEFICECLDGLHEHRELLAELGQDGEVKLEIDWFFGSTHSAGVLGVDALRKCAELGLDIVLSNYAYLPSQQSGEGT